MATLANGTATLHSHNLSVLRFALTGALAAAIFYVFCWIGTQIPFGTLSHMYLQLFTKADPSSMTALIEGACWSIGFGLIMGALIAVIYNSLAFLDRQ
jgi:hypothetical protein